jgi:hypothetical protein
MELLGRFPEQLLGNRLKSISWAVRFDGNEYSSSMTNPLEQFSPRFSASYDLNEKLSINFNTGRYYLASLLH